MRTDAGSMLRAPFHLCAVAFAALLMLFTCGLELDGQTSQQMMNVQGRLFDNAGIPLTGNYNMTFRLFAQEVGGVDVFTENQPVVPTMNGYYNVTLGSATPPNGIPSAVFTNPDLWLEIQIAAEVLTPRSRVVSSAYAYNADMLDAQHGSFYQDASNVNAGTLVSAYGGTGLAGAGGTANRVLLTTDGATWAAGQIDLATVQITGILPIARGGTNSGAALNNNRLMVSNGGAIVESALGAAGTVMTGTGAAPAFSATPTVTSLTTTGQAGHAFGPFGIAPGSTGEARFLELPANGVNYVGFKAPDNVPNFPGNIIWTLPNADGAANQVLATNGFGVLSWTSTAPGSAPVSATFVTMSLDGTLTSERVLTAGNGLSLTDGGANGNATLALGNMTANWSQGAAFDILLANAGSELQIMESVGGAFYGTFDVGDLGANQTYTFTTGGTVWTSGNDGAGSTLDADTLDGISSGGFNQGITAGSGIGVSGALPTQTVALGPLTADWNQTGAFDIRLNNANSELRILESAGATFYGTFDVTDLSADRTYTFPNAAGTVDLLEAAQTFTGQKTFSAGGANDTLTFWPQAVGAASFAGTLQNTDLTAARTWDLPDASGTIALTSQIAPLGSQFVTMVADVTLTNERVLTAGSGLSLTDGGAGGNATLALGNMTANWSQGAAFDILLANAGSELQIMESVGGAFYGTFDVGDLGANQTYTFTTGGTVWTSGNDGAGSTLDADTLDGISSGGFNQGITAGSGIGVSGALPTQTVALGPLTADWNQTGAFDIRLNNANSELRILENAGATFYGMFDVTDLGADRTYTFPNAAGTVITTGNLTDITATGTVASGTWNATAIGTQYGGTGQNWSATAAGSLPFFSAGGTMGTIAIGAAATYLRSSGAVPSWSAIQAADIPSGSGNYIQNQFGVDQNARFRISNTLAVTNEGVARIGMVPGADALMLDGLHISPTTVAWRGTHRGLRVSEIGLTGGGQDVRANGEVGSVWAWNSSGGAQGAVGTATPNILSNFDALQTSIGIGVHGTCGPTGTLTLNATGTYWVAGVMGELTGTINTTPAAGAVAAVLGRNAAAGTATSWAGYFIGNVGLGGSATAPELRLFEPSGSGTSFSAFRAQAQAGNVTYTLPAADGGVDQLLKTDGAGNLAWTSSLPGSDTDYIWNSTAAQTANFNVQNTGATSIGQIVDTDTGGTVLTLAQNFATGTMLQFDDDDNTTGEAAHYAMLVDCQGTTRFRVSTNGDLYTSGTTLDLGVTNLARTINIGTGTAADTINIGTDNTVADTITIGSALDSLTLSGQILGASPLVFEGATADGFETTFAITDPTLSDKVITFPNSTGTVLLSSTSGVVPLAGTVGRILYDDGSSWTALAAGTSNQVLVCGGGGAPSWSNTTTGSANPQLGVTTSSAVAGASALSGTASGAAQVYGVLGTASGAAAQATGVRGQATNVGAVQTYGVWGSYSSTGANSCGVRGNTTAAAAGIEFGVCGLYNAGAFPGTIGAAVAGSSSNAAGAGVFGQNTAAAGTKYAVRGLTTGAGTTNYAIYGDATGAATTNIGLYATASGATTNNYAAIFNAGYVGIGTTAPSASMSVAEAVGLGTVSNGTYAGFANAGLIFRSQSGGPILQSPGALITYTLQGLYGADIQFVTRPGAGTNAQEIMRVTSTGNVGIGTTNPGYKLEVSGAVKAADGIVTNEASSGAGTCFIEEKINTTQTLIEASYCRVSWNQATFQVTLTEKSGFSFTHYAGYKYESPAAATFLTGYAVPSGTSALATLDSNGDYIVIDISPREGNQGYIHLYCYYDNGSLVANYFFRYQ